MAAPKLQAKRPQKPDTLIVVGNVSLPENVASVLKKGPKFSVAPKVSAHELLALNRSISWSTDEENRERCLLEGADSLLRNRSSARPKLTTGGVVSFFKEHELSLLQADKEAGFVVMPTSSFLDKASAAITKNFLPTTVKASKHLTVRDWARLECINREAMRVVTGLPRCTPIPILQEEAQLNTIDELIYQRRQARELKPSFLPPAADLAAYICDPVSVSPPSIVSLPPWDHRQLTDNKPIGRLRNPAPRPTTTFLRHIEEADAALPTGSLVAYTDVSCTDTQVVTSIVVPGHQNLCVNRLYLLRAPVPSVSVELLAIRDATKLVSAACASSSSFTTIRTDSTSAIKELRKVYNAHTFAGDIQRITAQMPGQIRIQWIPRDTISAHIQADTATHSELPRIL
ncbi:hypothetical protein HPB52_006781 [Rhipicephalus sanguineus]|uniref:Uncharacterized protein n=1 Tax=Rhipicephalus sanguineus TaxID=34632 RepID=A0A9D4T8R6_RHISA|nr:hypothetical protein HPB52_006781 [Rhipicephalus sanguineus]